MYLLLLCSKNCVILQWIITSLILLLSTLRWLFLNSVQVPLNPILDHLSMDSNFHKCNLLKTENHYLLEDSFNRRIKYYTNDENGYLNKPVKELTFRETIELSNTSASIHYLKATVTYNLLQCTLGYTFSYMFQNNVLGKWQSNEYEF